MLSGLPCVQLADGGAEGGIPWTKNEAVGKLKSCKSLGRYYTKEDKSFVPMLLRWWGYNMPWEENPHTFHINYLANKIMQPQKVYFFFLTSPFCVLGEKKMMTTTMKALADCKVLQDLRRTIYSLSPCHDFSLGASLHRILRAEGWVFF